jgi:oligopeptide/dipeptide ABC transporter ATP-binding protein
MSATATATKTLMEIRDLQVHFALHETFKSRITGRGGRSVKAVDGVSFDLHEGEVLGLVGESGSGKTTLGRALLGLVRPTGGSVKLRGEELAGLPERQLRPKRRHLQMVFQDPHASLNPSMTLETALAHPLQIHKLTKGDAETKAKVREVLELVNLSPVEQFASRLPGDLSGGQKQRAAIARAIITNPDLVVADEPISMLDMSVRAKILDLMIDLKQRLGLTYVYVTHDLASAKFFCDRVAIMYLGRIVEIGTVEQIFNEPKHPYTQALIRAIPEPDPDKALPRDLPRGEVPDAASPPLGCSFHPRCPQAFGPCGWETRDLRAILDERWTNAGEEAYTTERGLFGDLDRLEAGHEAVVPAGSGRDPGELVKMLEQIRLQDPDEPLWKGVKEITAETHGVRVKFEPGIDPELYETGGARAACLLYKPGLRQESPAAPQTSGS